VLARTHQSLIWARQRHVNALRSAVREFYPGALIAPGAQLAESEALAVLALAQPRSRRLLRCRSTLPVQVGQVVEGAWAAP
jgi:hypothetical protein